MPKKAAPPSIRFHPRSDKEKEWFNPTEAVTYLGVSRATLYKLMDEGLLPFYVIKGIRKRRLRRDDLDALMEQGVPGKGDADEKDD